MQDINFLSYYFNLIQTWIEYYVGYLYFQFLDFSLVIKIAAVGVTICILTILFTLLKLLLSWWERRKYNKAYRAIDERFGEAIKYMLSPESPQMMRRSDALETLDLTEDDVQGRDVLRDFLEKMSMSRLIYNNVIDENASLDRISNLHLVIRIFRIQEFLENIANKGKMRHKTEGLLMLRAFKLPVNPWIANRLMNSKKLRVKRLAMYASIMAGSNKDLEYFESEFFDNNSCLYDEIQLGYVLQRRRSGRRQIPNLANLALHQKNPSTQKVFVRLMRLFDQSEHCAELEELFIQNNDNELLEEIARTWGYLKYIDGEELMNQAIITQNDETKVTIMHALTRLGTGHSLQTFIDGYRNSGDQKVRYEALRCLWNYGTEGRDKFHEFETAATGESRKLFAFFHNDITKEEIQLNHSARYRQRFGENIYSAV